MQYVIDTHVHIYPFYDVAATLDALLDNLGVADPGAQRVGCLTERFDCNLFDDLAAGGDSAVAERFGIEVDGEALRVTRRSDEARFHLLPGQQVITGENIEILSLACGQRVTEGQPAAKTVAAILEAGGVPVVAWAPGKWFFGRGRVVRSLIETFTPAELALGDTTLRPIGWLTPLIFREARLRGFRTLHGSDPLPYRGEERRAGSYCSSVAGAVGAGENPYYVVRSLLSREWSVEPLGRRGNLPVVAERLYRNSRAPRPSREPDR
jgi:hypothetical protein